MAGIAYREEILAGLIMLAVLHFIKVFDAAKDSTAHKNMRMRSMIRFDLIKAFVYPMDTILTVDHIEVLNMRSPVKIMCG
jgi:hypothetical protein